LNLDSAGSILYLINWPPGSVSVRIIYGSLALLPIEKLTIPVMWVVIVVFSLFLILILFCRVDDRSKTSECSILDNFGRTGSLSSSSTASEELPPSSLSEEAPPPLSPLYLTSQIVDIDSQASQRCIVVEP
jgi:hypothetical protein